MMEYWDLVDARRNRLGKKHRRGEPLPSGCYHTIVSIWVVDENDRILLTLRAEEKESYPLYWENTAGSVVSGETSTEAAVRELREETGLLVESTELMPLLSHRGNTTFCDSYFVRGEFGKQEIRLQPGETVASRWCSLTTLEEMIRGGLLAKPVVVRYRKVYSRLIEAMRNTLE